MRSVKAIIFDMDGVLVDSEPFHIEIEKRMFRKMGLDVSDKEHAGYMGTATDVMWRSIIEKRNLALDVDELTRLTVQEGIPFFKSFEKIEPMPGLEKLLKRLLKAKIPMAVASSSDAETVQVITEKSGLRKYFRYAISSSEVGKSKPEPDVFLHAAKLLGEKPANCLVIEDSKNGIKAAKAAGMFCVAYSGAAADSQDQTQADKIVSDYQELEHLLSELIET